MPPAFPQLDQDLQRAAERVVRQQQVDEIHRLEEVVEELRREKDSETQRAEGLGTDLAVSEVNRQKSLNVAIQYYKKQGNPFLVELKALSERVEEMRHEIRSRDNLIQDQNRVIEALGREAILYASKDHWILMQQRYHDLQQQYDQMPADMRSLERRYGDLENDYDDLSSSFRNLEADLTVLRAELSQVQDERNQFEDDASIAEQQLDDAVSRYREMKAKRDRILIQKAESEEQAEAKERLLADLASRMFKRAIVMADMLDDLGVDPVDEELISICRLAHEHLGVDAKDVYRDVEAAKAKEKRDGAAEAHAVTASSSATASNPKQQEPKIRLAGPSNSSNTVGHEEPESPNTYDARRRREVAAAEEAILGPLGLGFEDGSPTLKTIPRSSKPSRVADLVSTSPETPSKTRRGLFASGADIDQVTPARTGGTGGIARDQWQIAADDLHELTEVFRGPRMHPVDVVSPEATEDEEEGSRRDRDDSLLDSEGGAFSSPNEELVHENNPVEETEVEGDSGFAEEGAVVEGDNAATGIFNFSPSMIQAPIDAYQPPPFDQDFNFGGSNGAVSFTASQNAPSCLPTLAPELESAATPSILSTPLAEDSSALTAQTEDEVPIEEASEAIGENGQAEALSANMQNSKKAKAKAKKAEEKARKAEERKEAALKAKGPNRNQRRAASRERRAAEKKAQVEAKKVQSATAKAAGGRRAAMIGV